LEGKPQTELVMGERVVWIECYCPAKFALAACPIIFVEEFENRKGGVTFGGVIVQLDGLLSGVFCLGPGFRGGQDSFVVTSPEVAI
jgi:hypothetical protein